MTDILLHTSDQNPCLLCDCYDSDTESCTMPSSDRLYACPLEDDEYIDEENNSNEKIMRHLPVVRWIYRRGGCHSIEMMTSIVAELVKSGKSDAWILKNIGMDAEELLRLKQLSGIAELFKDKDFGHAWE